MAKLGNDPAKIKRQLHWHDLRISILNAGLPLAVRNSCEACSLPRGSEGVQLFMIIRKESGDGVKGHLPEPGDVFPFFEILLLRNRSLVG